jgi:molybdate-binding protein
MWLKEGKVHIAGSHLEDPKTGEFNLPFIRRELCHLYDSGMSSV